VGPTTVTGGDAVRAWRALTAQQRAIAWAAAKASAAPPDGALAAVMAGYGLRRQRQLQFAPLAVVVAFPAVLCGALLGLNAAGTDSTALELVAVAFMVIVIALVITNSVVRIRFGRLAAAGALGLEAAHRGVVPAGVPVPLAREGDFTVPFGAPAAAAPFHAPVLPVAPDLAGVVQLPTQRGRIAVAIGIFCVMLLVVGTVLLTTLVTALRGGPDPVEWVFVGFEGVALLTLVGLLGLLIVLLLPSLLSPVSARFSPAGWELPPSKLRGPWSEVQAIEVRAFGTGGAAYGRRTAPSTRIVVLRVPQPERYLRGLSPLRRWALGRSMRRYGSPVLLATGARSPVSLEQLLATLAQYTAAPVRWT
jgi:hypothetical protein